MFKSLGDTTIPQAQDKYCSAVTRPMLDDKTTIVSCVVSTGSTNGRSTIVTDVIGMPAGVAIAKFHLRMLDIYAENGYLQLQFNTPVAVESGTKPDIDAILASLDIAGGQTDTSDVPGPQQHQQAAPAPPPPSPAASPPSPPTGDQTPNRP